MNSETAILCDTLISWGCHNKVPQTEWLKTREIYSLTVLEGQKSEIKVSLGHIPCESPREESCLLDAHGSAFLGL